jgi:hypothetical protein
MTEEMRRAARQYVGGNPDDPEPISGGLLAMISAHVAGQQHAAAQIEAMTRHIAEMTDDQGARADWVAHADAIARGDWTRWDTEVKP